MRSRAPTWGDGRRKVGRNGGVFMTTHKRVIAGLSAMALLIGVGCAAKGPVSMPGDSVTLEMGKRDYKITGTGSGKDCKVVYLNMIQFEAPSYALAEQQALSQSGGTHLINKRFYDGVEGDYFVIADHCRWVEGTGVKF